MKHFLLSMVALLAFSGVTFAGDEPTSEVTVTTVENSVATTVEIAVQYAKNAAAPLKELGPQAAEVLWHFDNAITVFEAAIFQDAIDISEVLTLSEKATENFLSGQTLFFKGSMYFQMGSILTAEAETLEGTAAIVLRVEAAVYYYESVIYMEQSQVALNTVLETGEEGKILIEKLITEYAERMEE